MQTKPKSKTIQLKRLSPKWKRITNEEESIISVYLKKKMTVDFQRCLDFNIETLLFVFNMKGFTEKKYQHFCKRMNILKSIQSKQVLKIKKVVEKPAKQIVKIECDMSYEDPLKQYYNRYINIIEMEYKYHVNNLLEIYQFINEHQLRVDISIADISLVRYKDKSSPFGRIVLTPYAFMKALVIQQECKSKQMPPPTFNHCFAGVLEYMDDEMKRYHRNKLRFEGLIKELGSKDGDLMEIMEKNRVIIKCKEWNVLTPIDLTSITITKILGSGTFGVVMLVESKKDKSKKFAMKMSCHKFRDSLQREACVMSHLKHPNVVRFLGYEESQVCLPDLGSVPMDSDERKDMKKLIKRNEKMRGKIEGEPIYAYLMMEFCSCGNLHDYIENEYCDSDPIPIDQLELIVGQLVDAYLHMYNKRFVHRDLKPANILIKTLEPFIVLKLCDFGMARANEHVMRSGGGSDIINDPNITNKWEHTDTSDLYSLGCCLYYVLYAEYPIDKYDDMNEAWDGAYSDQMQTPRSLQGKYRPFIELVNKLLDISKRNPDEQQKRGELVRERHQKWNSFLEDPCVKMCLEKWSQLSITLDD